MPKDKTEIYSHPEDKTDVKKTWSCKALIFEKKGEVTHILLVPNEHDGHWGIPGGSVQEGEDEGATLERECREELDVAEFSILQHKKITSTEEVFKSPKDEKWRHKIYMWYLCSYDKSSNLGKGQFVPILEALSKVKDYEKRILQDIQHGEK